MHRNVVFLAFSDFVSWNRAEKEYAILSKQLSTELEEKKSVIKKLSQQLEQHQINFEDLKDELNKV